MAGAVDSVVREMQSRLDGLTHDQQHLRHFLGTYERTTLAVGKAVDDGFFEDPAWVEGGTSRSPALRGGPRRHLGGGSPSRPWRLAFDAPSELPPLRHVLLGINAHVNYDLPQALLAVISDADFADPVLLARRRRDHERIDCVLAARVAAEDDQLAPHGRSLTTACSSP